MIGPVLGLVLLVQGTAIPQLRDAGSGIPSIYVAAESVRTDVDRSETEFQGFLSGACGHCGTQHYFRCRLSRQCGCSAHLHNADIFDAFDRLSAATRTFVEVIGSKTILVSPDNQTKHRDYDWLVLKTIYPGTLTSPQQMSASITMLRTVLNMRYLMMAPEMNPIVLQDTPERMAAGEKLMAQSDKITSSEAIAIDHAGNLYVPDGNGVRKSSPARSRLQARTAGPTSIDLNGDSRTKYRALGAMAGLNILFDADFRSTGPIPLKLDNVDILDGLDYFGILTRTFWEPLDATTILVAPDNQVKRRDYQQLTVKTIGLPKNGVPNEITLVMTALRTLLNIRYLAGVSDIHALVMMRLRVGSLWRKRSLQIWDRLIKRSRPTASRWKSAMKPTDCSGPAPSVTHRHLDLRSIWPPPGRSLSTSMTPRAIALNELPGWADCTLPSTSVAPDNQSVRRSVEPRTETVIQTHPRQNGWSELPKVMPPGGSGAD